MRDLMRAGVALIVALVVVSCGAPSSAEGTQAPTSAPSSSGSPEASASTPRTARKVTRDGTVTTRLTAPWGLAFLPDGSALVSERDTGRIRRVPADGGAAAVVGRVTGVRPGGEGGLLGIAVPPGDDPQAVFAYFTSARDNRVVRIAWDGERLGRQAPILTGIPKNTYHDGGRLLVDGDALFVATGDAGDSSNAQKRTSLAGKILRITFDGEPAPGNPFSNSPVYSLGHRNVQGLALDSQGRLWATEFGEKDVDELNLIHAGRNYGWPIHEGSDGGDTRYVDPFAQWSPTALASPSGLAVLDDVAYVASLRGQVLWRVPLTGPRAGEPKKALGGLGRLRAVAVAPDQSLWLVTSNTDGRGNAGRRDDRIVRLRVS